MTTTNEPVEPVVDRTMSCPMCRGNGVVDVDAAARCATCGDRVALVEARERRVEVLELELLARVQEAATAVLDLLDRVDRDRAARAAAADR